MYAVAGRPDTPVLVASSAGYGFASRIADMVSNRKAGRDFMTIAPGETPIAPVMYEASQARFIAALSALGRMLVFDAAEMRSVSRGRGVIVMGLEAEEKLVAVSVLAARAVRVRGMKAGKEREVDLSGSKFEHYLGHRARMGRLLPDKLKPVGFVT
jgi:topoisomerase-4 subunit A